MGRRSYRITIRAGLTERYAATFGSIALECRPGLTTLVGELDQAQLYGLIERLRDLGLELVRVEEGT